MTPARFCLFILWSLINASISTSYAHDIRNAHRQPTKNQRPHIILIVADDLGYNDVTFHGSEQIPTPNIDFLGYNGVLLNNYYVSPICTPTRAALMTGRYPIHTGMQHSVIGGGQPWGLPLNETLIPEYLNQLGYRSHIVGKWHLGSFDWKHTPTYRGFETHFGYFNGQEDYYTHVAELADQWGIDFWRNEELLWNYTGHYSTYLFRDEALDVIEKHDTEEPLFLYLAFQGVHSGNPDDIVIQAPAEYIEKFRYIKDEPRRNYAGALSCLDDAVGDVYDLLKKRKMLENSIIIFTTDNGGPVSGFKNNAASNFPLRGTKSTVWEGGLRGVGLIHSPLIKQQGCVANNLVHVCDWLPTLVSAAGGAHLLKNVTNLDGVDVWDMLVNNGSAVRTEILHNIDPIKNASAIRVGEYKLIAGAGVNTKWGGWYPVPNLDKDGEVLYYERFENRSQSRSSDSEQELAATYQARKKLVSNYRYHWPKSAIERMEELYDFAEKSPLYHGPYAKLNVGEMFETIDEGSTEISTRRRSVNESNLVVRESGIPVRVNCGLKPANASTNCKPRKSVCLFHIASDPCEYNNIASWNPEIVQKLLDRLEWYNSNMVAPRNKHGDPAGYPDVNQDAWAPWM